LFLNKIIFLICSFFFGSLTFGALQEHSDYVRKICDKAAPLLVKKSALELNSDANNCKQKFTSQLLIDCKALSCEQLINSINKNLHGRSGSVVGE
jgi:hypothetical protein